MAQSSKAAARRGKPSYVMSIIGVTLVLFLLGIVGWLVINATKLGDYFRENVEVKVHLRGDVSAKDSTTLMQYFAAQPYVKNYSFVTKEAAREKYLTDGNEDWNQILDYNPLPNSIYFNVKKEYVQVDTLENIRNTIVQNLSAQVTDVQYPKELVTNLNKNLRNISLILLVVAIVLAIVVIVLIDNTIRLAMFSNRFLIKTMQMVGATRSFIARPLNIRAIANGAISAVIAIVLIYVLITIAGNLVPEIKVVHSNSTLILLFLVLIVIGITITLFSTYRSVLKYLRMKLDELY
ncbi:MAG TPA: permease-like cell division protein FtsX [Flavisolibacter sp.]|nr:permease-like cell division protein FtsX [Flavisolibacter sp.]